MHILYISGAPRLSTRSDSESLGPRSHILGVISAFRSSNAVVETLIIGDSTPSSFSAKGSENRLSSSKFHMLAADVLRLIYGARARRKTSKICRDQSFDFAYERYALFQSMGRAAKKRGIPWVLEVNALLSVEATTERKATTSRWLAHWVEGRTVRAADLVVVVTEELSLALQSTHRVAPKQIVVIENGVDHTRFAPVAPSVALSAGMRIGFVGALYGWQNLALLLETMASPGLSTTVLEIVGDGPTRRQLEEQVLELGLGDRVTFKGRLTPNEIPDFLASVDICFAGHGSENGTYFSPLKLWEYLAAGKPVLSSTHNASVQLAEIGFAILLFDTTKPASLQSALTEAVRELPELAKTAAKMQPSVRGRYSWEARVQPLLKRFGGE